MTDEQIIKALECCSQIDKCGDCPYGMSCLDEQYSSVICKDAFELVSRQKAEIERLTINMNAFGRGMQIEAENVKNAKSEAIKEFAERLKAKMIITHHSKEGYCVYEFDDELIDDLVKETVGDSDS